MNLNQANYFKLISTRIIEKLALNDFYEIKILEIGCGDGSLVRSLDKYLNEYFPDVDITVYGIDYTSTSENTNTKLHATDTLFKLSSISENYPFEPNYFDFVYSNQVLEHVEDINKFFLEVSRVMKVNSLFISLYPKKSIIIEPHCFIPLVHYFPKQLQYLIIKSWPKHLRLGNKSISRSSMANYIVNHTFYRSLKHINSIARENSLDSIKFSNTLPTYCTHSLQMPPPKQYQFIRLLFQSFLNCMWDLLKSSTIGYKKI